MAVIKCKMCGGDLTILPGETVAQCEYCGSRQTVPTPDNEKKLTLFARANRLRTACEFDKAAGVYESIVAEFPEEAEAYWGLVLCKYGIEYVDDPATGRKIPTCHRSSFDSILDDSDFEQALENADAVARKVYREEAKQIEELRKGIIEVSGKEKPYDIFICYKETDENGQRTIDSVLAQDVYDALTARGYRVFFSRITLEDKLGQEYEPYIFAALNSARIMLAFGTDYEYFNAVWVKNEWSRFLKLMEKDKTRHLIPCYKGLDAYDMPREFIRLQAQDLGKVGAIQDLLRGIEKIIQKPEEPAAAEQPPFHTSPNTTSLLRRASLFLEDGKWEEADAYCEKVLDIDPENPTAYLYKLMTQYRVHQRGELKVCEEPFDHNASFKKILRFGDPAIVGEVQGYLDCVAQRCRLAAEREKKAKETIKKAGDLISAGSGHTVGLKSDGTVMAVGDNEYGRCNVSGWKDMVAICAGSGHTVGLKADGTVVAVGYNEYGQCNVRGWRNIVSISAGSGHTVGLKADGTVVAVGDNEYGRCNVSGWQDMVAISAGTWHTVGLKSDGTVVAVGSNKEGQCDVSGWQDMVAIRAGSRRTVGLKSDGTVVAVGSNKEGQCDVSGWQDIVAIRAGTWHTVGLKRDGTVVAVGSNISGQCNVRGWQDIVAISAGSDHTVGLKRDGTMVAVGNNDDGQCYVSGWKLFGNLESIEEEREEARKKEELLRAERKAALEREKTSLQTELANLKGFFTGSRRGEIESRLGQIEAYLKGLN